MKTVAGLVAASAILVLNSLGQQGQGDKPKVSDQSLTSEQLAVYHGLLSNWFGKEQIRINLAAVTDPPPQPDSFGYDKTCVKESDFEPLQTIAAHRIRRDDLGALGPGEIRLVDPDEGSKEVSDNDPGKAIRAGKPVDSAVENGFSHALFTFSEIRFSKDHTRAVVSFSFVCGGLCGNGSTLILARQKDGTWKKVRTCGGWVS